MGRALRRAAADAARRGNRRDSVRVRRHLYAADDDFDDAVINYLRYGLESRGMTISSVQSNSFGDGRAFKAQVTDGNALSIVYLFRVRNLLASVNYVGAAAAGDLDTQAVNVARGQALHSGRRGVVEYTADRPCSIGR